MRVRGMLYDVIQQSLKHRTIDKERKQTTNIKILRN